MSKDLDIVLRSVPGYGWLPILVGKVGGKPRTIYTGEYKASPSDAFERATKVLLGECPVHDVEVYLGRRG